MEDRMKKLFMIIISLFILVSSSPSAFAKGFKVGGSLNYYAVSDTIYKDTYGEGNLMFGGSLSYELIRRIELRVEANYFRDKGEMTTTKEEITLTLMPIVIGVRLRLINLSVFSPYLGAGVDYYAFKESLPERFEDVSESATGFHAEVGSYLNIIPGFYLDLNVRYASVNAKPFDETIKLGGLRAGVGIGFGF